MAIKFPTNPNIDDEFDAGFHRFKYNGFSWTRKLIDIEEVKFKADQAAQEAAAAAIAEAEAAKAAAEQAKAEALVAAASAQQLVLDALAAADAAISQADSANAVAVSQAIDAADAAIMGASTIAAATLTDAKSQIVGNAPENLDTIEEIANAITKTANQTLTASFVVDSTHLNNLIICNSAGTISVTLIDDQTIPVGSEVAFLRQGAGAVQFVASGVTIISTGGKLSIKDQYGTAAIMKVTDTIWSLVGGLA